MAKTDLKRELDCYRAVRDEPRFLDVPELRYLMVDGHGDPNHGDFDEATATLYPVAYAMKFASRDLGHDYVVPPLEGLWWADDLRSFTEVRDKRRWRWTLLSLVPAWVTDDVYAAALARAADKRDLPRADGLRLATLSEGRCVQSLHVGAFDDEGPLLRRMHVLAAEHGLALSGTHHEIYLSDPRRTAPSRLRTILRQPVMAPR